MPEKTLSRCWMMSSSIGMKRAASERHEAGENARHLDARELPSVGVRVVQKHREVDGQPRNVGERMRGSTASGVRIGKMRSVEQLVHALRSSSFSSFQSMIRMPSDASAGGRPRWKTRATRSVTARRCWRNHVVQIARHDARRCGHGHAGVDAPLQSGHPAP